jgi:minor extracellular serine protease Vpr
MSSDGLINGRLSITKLQPGFMTMRHKLYSFLMTIGLFFSFSTSALAQNSTPSFDRFSNREVPASLADLKLETPVESSGLSIGSVDPSLLDAEGASKVIVRLVRPSVSEQGLVDAAAVRERQNLRQQQAALLNRVLALDPNARLVARVQIVLNAIFIEVDASILPQLAQDPAVLRIAPVANYEMDLEETVPYIGASAAQSLGFTGKGIKVAVLDSGIDYTHAAFGGPGTVDFYNTCYAQRDVAPSGDCADYFGPGAAKVVGGL